MATHPGGGLQIEILDLDAEGPDAMAGDHLADTYEPPPPRPSRIEPLVRRADEVEQRLDRVLFRMGRRRALGRAGNPRRDSRMRLHVWAPFPEVCAGLDSIASSIIGDGGASLTFTGSFADGPKKAQRAPATMKLRGSWPALPVWVTVEPWWRNRTVTTISLRHGRRWRYPRRYFAAAYSVGQALSRAALAEP